MTPAELQAACEAAIARRSKTAGVWIRPHVYLVLPAPQGVGNTVRLLGRQGGPRGRVCAVKDGQVVAVFDARKVLAYLKRLEGAAA